MKRFKSHKECHAAKILAIHAEGKGGRRLTLENDEIKIVDRTWCTRHLPHEGGYFVQYLDGYTSFSPAKPFEDGWEEISESESKPKAQRKKISSKAK